ncbi:hypothetical protein NX059_002381 [Plenodomus lindquistii]|nr:hypothetical protein NX059_002381 [Plenodomus lindquistii]
MVTQSSAERTRSLAAGNQSEQLVPTKETVKEIVVGANEASSLNERDDSDRSSYIPLKMKIIAILLVTAIGFGSRWSSGVTGAMKSTLKKKLKINNAQFSVLEASEDFMKTALILASGLVTDRIGGANAMLWGNAIYTTGAIFIAAATTVRSYKFMIFGVVVQAFGDIATQVAQYKIFSSWFAPSNGFASTLGFELGIGKIGAFVGKSTANPIAKGTGDFMWVYWTAVFMNLFTNVVTVGYWYFTRWCSKKYTGTYDPATGEKLTESNKKFEIKKVLELPWTFWSIVAFSLFQTSTAAIFNQNSTELAEQRFNMDSVQAGWYSSMAQYLGFFLVPLIGVFIDLLGNRITLMLVCGLGMLLSMCLAAWGPTFSGTAAAFGIYGVANNFGPTVIIDSIRTSMWFQEVFGSAYAVKIAVNNSMNIIVRIVTGVIQDRDNDSYDNVVIAYVALAAGSTLVGALLFAGSFWTVDLKHLQWIRKQRIAKGDLINERREQFGAGAEGQKNRKLSISFFVALIFLVLGAWAAYFWGVATGNNG